MAKIQCKMCGGELTLPEGVYSGNCEYCGCLVTFPKISSEQEEQLYNRAEHFRRINEYDKAVAAYERIINTNPDDPEAYWGLVLSRFGIEYVEDPVSHERIPTCHRVQFESILADADYLAALERADYAEKEIYETEAKRIAEIQKGILAISNQEEPFDVFICYKESDDFGKRTRDSVLAQDIYYALTQEGLKVFFSRITLEGKLGQQYEPYIFAALNSAKAMLVIGSKPEYFNAVWVRNEWSRYLTLMKRDRSKLLIPCFRDMDAYDIPEELSMFQAQDMSKIGFIQDILHGVKKVAAKSAPAAAPAAAMSSGKSNPLLRRAQLFVETGDFESAVKYCEKLLDSDPENGWAYFCRMKAELKISDEKQLEMLDFTGSKSFALAQRFADDELKAKIANIFEVKRKAEEARIEAERKAEEARQTDQMLRNEVPERITLLQNHLRLEKKLQKRQNIIQALEQSIEQENSLLRRDDLLTAEIVSPVKEYSEHAMEVAGDLSEKQDKYGWRLVAYTAIVFVSLIVVVVIAALLFVSHEKKMLVSGDVCRIKNNAVTGVRCDREKITKVVIPDGVTKIDDLAFWHCTNLPSVTIPNSVTKIGWRAFTHCTSLTSVTIPNSVTYIGDEAFDDCTNLQSVTIPDGVTYIGSGAFRGCSNLQSVTIPNGVTSINSEAFRGCSNLQSVTIPNGVTHIWGGAFADCSNLQSVTIPNGVTFIGEWAFYGCSKLQSVTIPDSVIHIRNGVFDGCSSLRLVRVPRRCQFDSGTFPAGCRVIRY